MKTIKEECHLADTGYIQVRAFTSYAQIPLQDVAVTVTDENDSAVAMRLTNRNGQLDVPIPINVPNKSAGLTPDTGVTPYSTVRLYAKKTNYEEIDVAGIQVFPGTITEQNLEMIPLSEFPKAWNKAEQFQTQPQNL